MPAHTYPISPDPPRPALAEKRDREAFVAALDGVLHRIRTTILGRRGCTPASYSIDPLLDAVTAIEQMVEEAG